MSNSKVVGYMKDVSYLGVNLIWLAAISIIAIRGVIVTTFAMYPDAMVLINEGITLNTARLQFAMASMIFFQIVLSLIMYAYAHRAYKRLKDFTWGQR